MCAEILPRHGVRERQAAEEARRQQELIEQQVQQRRFELQAREEEVCLATWNDLYVVMSAFFTTMATVSVTLMV
jgi:hypothetical protein